MTVDRTALGQQALTERNIQLSRRQRSALFLVDGKRDFDGLVELAAAAGVSKEDLELLFALGLLRAAGEARNHMHQPPVVQLHVGRSEEERFKDAYPVACRLTRELGLGGFFLNLQVKAAGNYQQLAELAPKIREAVGEKKFSALNIALNNWTRV